MKKLLGILVLGLLFFSTLTFADEDTILRENIPIGVCDKIYATLDFDKKPYSKKIDLYTKFVISNLTVNEKNNTFNVLLDRHFSYKEPLVLDTLKNFDEYEIIKYNLEIENDIYCKYDLDTAIKDRKFRDLQFYYDDMNKVESNIKNWIKVYTSGWIVYSYYDETYTFTNDNFNFRKFPFDRQNLAIVQFSDVANFVNFSLSDSLKNKISKQNSNKNFEIVTSGWKIKSFDIKTIYSSSFWKDEDRDNYSSHQIFINIERNSFSYLIKYGFPTVFIVFIAWCVFWIDPRDIKTRAELSIICLLSLIAFNFVITDKLPDLNYLTLFDSLMLVSYLYAGAATVLSVLGNVYIRSKRKKFSSLIDTKARKWGVPSFIIINLLFSLLILSQ